MPSKLYSSNISSGIKSLTSFKASRQDLTDLVINLADKDNITKDEPPKQETTSSSSSSSSSGQTYWASSNSNKFHYPGCEWAQKISGKNKVVFHSRDEALNSGYQPCQVCGP